MIQDVDDALREIVLRDVIVGQNGVSVEFDAPTTEWAARQNSPAIDVYLYDITENTRRRQVAHEHRVGEDGRTVSHAEMPPRRYNLCYLLTAWTQRPEDEHRLLSALLSCFLQYPTMPREVMSDAHAAVGYSTTITVALPRPDSRQAIEVWNSMGGELKPSLDLVVTVPLFAGTTKEVGPPVYEDARFSFDDGLRSETVSGGGRRGRGRSVTGSQIPAETVYGGSPDITKAGKSKTKKKGSVGDGRVGRVFAVGGTQPGDDDDDSSDDDHAD